MRKIVVQAFVTLDGVAQAPGGPTEDPSGGFEHGGWLVPFAEEDFGRRVVELTQRADALLLGRRTYDIFAGHWPRMPEDDPIAAHLNGVQKHVASRTLERAEWQPTTILRDAAEEVGALRDGEGGEVHVIGSVGLVQTLLRQDLVDVIRLFTFPIVLGEGKRLFAEGAVPRAFRLVESAVSPTGVVYAELERSGLPTYASFQLD
jgi:dihydrofolate reductase